MNVSPIRPTLLSLQRYAQIIGLNPVHFSGAYGNTVWPEQGSCSTNWTRYPWQSIDNRVSWAELAEEINNAEQDITKVLGYSPAPVWNVEEVVRYPHGYATGRQTYGMSAANRPISLKPRHGRIIACGQRDTTVIDAGATVTYSDPDGDGFDELATITASTALLLNEGIKVYFAGTSANPSWEIRPLKSMSISAGTLTITIDSWNLIDPDIHGTPPSSLVVAGALDADDSGNYVTTVDIYREHLSASKASSEFWWNGDGIGTTCISCGGTGCNLCTHTSQDGCATISDPMLGYITPYPATYDTSWTTSTYSVCRDPDFVKLWYYAGEISSDYLSGYSLDPLSEYWAQTIAKLASARLSKPICGCSNVENVVSNLQRDMTKSSGSEFYFRSAWQDIFNNPFGLRVGEVEAWRRVHEMTGDAIWSSGSL